MAKSVFLALPNTPNSNKDLFKDTMIFIPEFFSVAFLLTSSFLLLTQRSAFSLAQRFSLVTEHNGFEV